MSTISIEIDGSAELIARFENEPARQALIAQTLDAHLALLHGTVVPLTPVFTGALRASWSTQSEVGPTSFEGMMGSPLIYAPVQEEGRTPGATPPPPDALVAWMERKMGVDPWGGKGPVDGPAIWYTPVGRLSLSISRKGTRGHHMLLQTVEDTRPAAQALWDACGGRLLEVS